MLGVGIPSIARRVSRWLAKDYQSTRERCSRSRGGRLSPLLYIFGGALQLYVFVSGAALRLGMELVFALFGTGSVLLGAYFALCCYATPSRLVRAVASSLNLSALALLSAASVLFVLRLAGWVPSW